MHNGIKKIKTISIKKSIVKQDMFLIIGSYNNYISHTFIFEFYGRPCPGKPRPGMPSPGKPRPGKRPCPDRRLRPDRMLYEVG